MLHTVMGTLLFWRGYIQQSVADFQIYLFQTISTRVLAFIVQKRIDFENELRIGEYLPLRQCATCRLFLSNRHTCERDSWIFLSQISPPRLISRIKDKNGELQNCVIQFTILVFYPRNQKWQRNFHYSFCYRPRSSTSSSGDVLPSHVWQSERDRQHVAHNLKVRWKIHVRYTSARELEKKFRTNPIRKRLRFRNKANY